MKSSEQQAGDACACEARGRASVVASRKGEVGWTKQVKGGSNSGSRSQNVSAVGFEPTSANTVELESTPLDRSGTLTSVGSQHPRFHTNKLAPRSTHRAPHAQPATATSAHMHYSLRHALQSTSPTHANTILCQCTCRTRYTRNTKHNAPMPIQQLRMQYHTHTQPASH